MANPTRSVAQPAKPKRRTRRIAEQTGGQAKAKTEFALGPFPLADGRVRHVCPITGRSKILEYVVSEPPVGSFDEDFLEGLL